MKFTKERVDEGTLRKCASETDFLFPITCNLKPNAVINHP